MTIGMNNLGNNGRAGNQMFQYAALVGIQSSVDLILGFQNPAIYQEYLVCCTVVIDME